MARGSWKCWEVVDGGVCVVVGGDWWYDVSDGWRWSDSLVRYSSLANR